MRSQFIDLAQYISQSLMIGTSRIRSFVRRSRLKMQTQPSSLPEARALILGQIWPGLAGVPVLGVVKLGGAGAELYENELELFEKKYCGSISREDFEMLDQDTIEIDQLAKDVIFLAELIVMPRTVFPIRPFTKVYKDVFHSWQDACKDFNFEVLDTEEPNSSEPILPRILDGIRRSAFVIADVTEVKPNVFMK